MSQESEKSLRKSLDDIDGISKRQGAAFAILFCVMVGLSIWLGYIIENPATDVRRAILAAVFVLLIGMVYVSSTLAMLQSRMTLRILKAIELLSKK